MPKNPIPTDWDGETFECVIIEWPFSEQWFGLLRGLITSTGRGRFWDERTGSLVDIQEVGLEIERRNPVSICEDISIALQGIQAAIEGIDVNSDTQVTIQTDIANELVIQNTALAQANALSLSGSVAIASAFAWSSSLAQTFVGVKIINNVELQMRSLEPGTTEAPTASEEDDTGISSTPQSTSDAEICKRSFWLVYTAWKFFNYLVQVNPVILGTILSAGGAIGDALASITNLVSGGSIRSILPASVLLQVSHLFSSLFEKGLLQDELEALEAWLSEVDRLACNLSEMVIQNDPTGEMLAWLHNDAQSWGGVDPTAVGLLNAVFSLNSLAALYFQSPFLAAAPNVLPGYDADCDVCAE